MSTSEYSAIPINRPFSICHTRHMIEKSSSTRNPPSVRASAALSNVFEWLRTKIRSLDFLVSSSRGMWVGWVIMSSKTERDETQSPNSSESNTPTLETQIGSLSTNFQYEQRH